MAIARTHAVADAVPPNQPGPKRRWESLTKKKPYWMRLLAALGLLPEDVPLVLGANLLGAILLWYAAGVSFVAAACLTLGVTVVFMILVAIIWRA